jgi:N-methylhydantoinase A/oxoprolinase/acetone carboxylase beta subunit
MARQCHNGWGSPEESVTSEVVEAALAATFLAMATAAVGGGSHIKVLRQSGEGGK